MPAKHQVVSKITFLVKRKRSEQLGKLSFATRVIVVVHGVVDRDIAIVIVGGLWLWACANGVTLRAGDRTNR